MKKFPGTPPTDLGVSRDGRLKACANKPNCVCSQSRHKRHAIEPITFDTEPGQAMKALQAVLSDLPRTILIRHSKDYIQAECSSRWLGFTDDVEFSCNRTKRVIHVRSASRLGYFDLGANRRRVEKIRKALRRRLSS